jgi:hypothetical protein
MEANSMEMKSIVVHEEFSKEDAAVKPVRGQEVVQGRESGCRTPPGTKGMVPEEVGCCLQEGVPLCKSGMAQR